MFRSRYHYKENEVHDRPLRRNRDFKPVLYGAFHGIPNYKHGEPWMMLKNLGDMMYEPHQFMVKYAKLFITGGIFGFTYSLFHMAMAPMQAFPTRKLF